MSATPPQAMRPALLLTTYAISTGCAWTIGFLIPLRLLAITHSALWVALGYVAAMAPYIIVTPFAGVWSDRYAPRRFLIGTDLASLLVALLIAAGIGYLPAPLLPGSLVALAFLIASLSATHHPVFQGIVPRLFADAQRVQVNAWVNLIDNCVRIGAPAGAAALLALVPDTRVLLVCAAGYLASIALLMCMPRLSRAHASRNGIGAELAAGFRFVFADANLSAFSLLFFMVNFGLSIVAANLVPIYAAYGVSQTQIGLHYAILGAGAVAGSLAARRLIGRFRDATLIIGHCAAAGALALLTCTAGSPLLFSLIWAVSCGCQSVVIVTFFTFRQKVVPAPLLGRTVGVTRLISYLAIPPASLLGGWLMSAHGVTVVMIAGGLSVLSGALLARRAPAFGT